MFIDTLKGVLYDHLIGHPSVNFTDIIMTGERIKDAVKKGKIIVPRGIAPRQGQDSHIHMVSARSINQPQGGPCKQFSWSEKPKKVIQPIPISYAELLPTLVEKKLLAPVQSKPKEPPYPEGYDVNAICDYHLGSTGHTTEKCGALKNKVQDLIDKGLLKF